MVQTVWAVRSHPEGQRPEGSQILAALPHSKTCRSAQDDASAQLSLNFLRLLANRGLITPDEIEDYLFSSKEKFLNPFLMKGMKEAVARIQKAKETGEKVLVHGDYDADGVTGAAIVSLTLERLGIPFETFLPERDKDGYGVSLEAVQKAGREGFSLLITVDCGITAAGQIKEAREIGIETLVLDHHQIPLSGLPPAFAILNPLQDGCAYPFKELSAGGLAFKLAQALLSSESFEYLDLATLSTVADMAPIRGENRIIVREGLRQLSQRKRAGIKALSQSANVRAREIKTSHVGFIFGPRINASGRMSTARTAFRLLLTTNQKEAESLAQILEQENRQRQQTEKKVLEEAAEQVERTVNFAKDRVLVVAQQGWHAGVIGIVAARLVEKYHRPSLVIALKEKEGKGSGRSIRSIHLVKALESASEFLLEFGGHEQAAGFSVEENQIPLLRKKLNEHCKGIYPAETFLKSIDVDLEIKFTDLTPQFLKEIQLLEPYGIGNQKPVFLTRALQIKTVQTKKTKSYTRTQVWMTDGNYTYEVTASQRSGVRFDFKPGEQIDLVYSIDQKSWEGQTTTVLEAKDVKPSQQSF